MTNDSLSEYAVHPSVAYAQGVIAGMKRKTGRSIDEWITFVQTDGPESEEERRAWLKSCHGLGTNYAWWIAARSAGRQDDTADPDGYLRRAPRYVEAMYAGKRAALRPLHDALIDLGRSLGPDVKVCPCSTMVPLFRNFVFAQIKPATNTRIDLGFALKDTAVSGRLIDTGGYEKKDRITRRIPITALNDIDDEVAHWLRAAYDIDSR